MAGRMATTSAPVIGVLIASLLAPLQGFSQTELTWAHAAAALTSLDIDQPSEPGSALPLMPASVEPSPASAPCPFCQSDASRHSSPSLTTCCHGRPIVWSDLPETIYAPPRAGMFPIPPVQGVNHYSLWDHATGQTDTAAPKSGYASFAVNAWPFSDADWRFVEGISPNDRTLVERLKRIHWNDCLLFSTGGEFWSRHHKEHNSRLRTTQNEFDLLHVRMYGDLSYSDWLRIYAEYVWADSLGEDLVPASPDVDRGDILNLFADVKLLDCGGKPVYVRVGRQELLYGSQRLITPLSWANKRHTFEGVKVFRRGEKWDFAALWTQFVPPDPDDFDQPDENQDLASAWLTYRRKQGEFWDLYYIWFDNDNNVIQEGIVRQPFETHTFGSRWAGDNDGLLWDWEGALQFGSQAGSDQFAGMATAGLGRAWRSAHLSPTAWIYYDYASGDVDPSAGSAHTFNQLFAFGHYYLGWMDLVGRQNIHDLNAHLYLYPAPWITVWLQYHHFWLDESRDALYNAAGVAYRRDPSGQSGTNVGDEIDVVLNFHLTRYSDVLVSYNKLFGGEFLERTAGPNQAADAETLYLIVQQRW